MRGNSFGKLFSFTTFGESHGTAYGIILDGVPSNLPFDLENLKKELKARAPGHLPGTTLRIEDDEPHLLSGIFEGKTLGTPIGIIVFNKNQNPNEYRSFKNHYRAGHADETTLMKYGIRDHRGGGRSSGRETLTRVIAGYFASLIFKNKVKVTAQVVKLGPFLNDTTDFQEYPPYYVNQEKNIIQDYLLELQRKGESIGAQVALQVSPMIKGLGEPAFDKLKADLGKALLSIGGVMGIEFGDGAKFAEKMGSYFSTNRDSFGGIEGGISNGFTLRLKVIIKPPSTVGKKSQEGRHDPCLVPRIIPVLKSMVLVVLADHYLRQRAYVNEQD